MCRSASLFTFCIQGWQGKLPCMLYSAGTDQDYPTIIFAHGFPGHEKNAALAQLLRKAGFHVLIFYYGGSWGSEGVFSFAGSIRDTLAVIDYLMADTNYHIDKRHIFLLGHSYGAPVIARAMEQRPSIFGGIFLMPYDLGRAYLMSRTNSKVSKGLMQLLQEGAEILPDTSSEQLYQEIQKQPDNYSYFPMVKFLSQKPIYWASCKNDEQAPENVHTRPFMELLKKYPRNRILWHSYDTDHYFSDMQERLAREIACFIEKTMEQEGASWLEPSVFRERLWQMIATEFQTITSSQAASRFHISEPYFCSIVKKSTGTTFSALLLKQRMSLAVQLLETGAMPVTAIAEYLGYSDPAYFEKVFKKYYQQSPSDFRRVDTEAANALLDSTS